MEWSIPLGALVVSVATLVFTAIQYKQMGRKAFVEDVNQKIKELREDLRDCERTCMRLKRENTDLMRQLLGKSDVGPSES